MSLVIRSLVLALAVALAVAGPSPGRRSSGNSNSKITFVNERYGPAPVHGGSVQSGMTDATSVQRTTGDGQQINQGTATGVSTQKQTGLGGATQVTNNQGVIQALQQANGGDGNGQQTSNNQVNIVSNQQQQNVEGTLINVHDGNEGIVIINTNDNTGAVVGQEVINNKPVGEQTAESAKCRYTCIRPLSKEPYCCDNGSNTRGKWTINGGKCPEVRGLCDRKSFFRRCAHDGQCAKSDKCCYDACAQHHICKSADTV